MRREVGVFHLPFLIVPAMATKKKTFTAVKSSSGASLTPWLGIAFIVILLDQISKITITRTFTHGEEKPITGFFNLAGVGHPGHLVEFNSTEKIFSNPEEKATEDYISGRFG